MKHHHFLKILSLALLVTGCPLHNAVAESHCQLQSSAITGNVQEVGFEQFGTRMLIGGMTWAASNMISTAIANKKGISLEFKTTYDYDLDPYGDNVVLYRGVSGAEGNGGSLFLTDNIDYATAYAKRYGGNVASVMLPRSTLRLMEINSDLGLLRGSLVDQLETGMELEIYSRSVIDEIIQRFNYLK